MTQQEEAQQLKRVLKPATLPESEGRRLRAGEFTPGRLTGFVLRLSQARADFAGSLASALAYERDTGSLFNFAPVVFALGILTYFSIASEPVAAVLWITAVLAAALALRLQVRRGVFYLAVTAALFFAGMGAAQLRVVTTDAPVIERQMTVEIAGLIVAVDANARGSPRYLIKPQSIAGLGQDQLPERIRLSAAAGKVRFSPGDTIAGKARLVPFSGPAYPGGYDFGFFARFDRLGGTGFFLGAPREAAAQASEGWRERIAVELNNFRLVLGKRIHAGLPGEAGDIATALVTGDRSGIDEATVESLRRSGLAHVLAISGLHMALVALTVVWSLRWLLAWSPAIALNFSVGKWAAAIGLAAATGYLVISGASVATQRAWVMIAVMLTATLADRRAITIRNVAIAALAILATSPGSIMQPGFQMSFAATTALVAAYEGWRKRGWRVSASTDNRNRHWAIRLVGALPYYFAGIAFTSLVAGLATGLFAAWHFQRVAMFGLLANMLAMPVFTLLVMPLALVCVLAMPYGLEAPVLGPLGWAIERMVAISDWVSGISPTGVTGLQPLSVLFAGSAGLITLTLLKTRLRFLGLAPIAVLPLLFGGSGTPDILASQDGRAVAVADRNGRLVPLYPKRNRFVTDIWLRAWSGGREGDPKGIIGACDRDSCAATLRTGQTLLVVYDPDLLDDACRKADILLMPRLRWLHCPKIQGKVREPALVLKRGDFEAGGSYAMRLETQSTAAGANPVRQTGGEGTAPKIHVTASILPGTRPWNRPLPDNGDNAR